MTNHRELEIGFFSDLYLEKNPAVKMSTASLDLLICLGDLRSGIDGAKKAIQDLKNISRTLPIIYVPGNEEFQGQTIREGIAALRKASRKSNVRILYRDAVDLAGIRFLGTTFWTDFELFGPEMRTACEKEVVDMIPDFQLNYGPDGELWTPEDARMEHLKDVKWLKKHFNQDRDMPKVLLTHFAPSIQSLAPEYADNIVSSYYVSKRDDLVNQTILTLHGHLHDKKNYTVGHTKKTIVASNPRGGMREVKQSNGETSWVADNRHFQSPRRLSINLDTMEVTLKD